MTHYREIADAEFADRHAENMARTNVEHDNHMPPDTLPLEIMRGMIWFLTTLLIVMIVALVIAQITK